MVVAVCWLVGVGVVVVTTVVVAAAFILAIAGLEFMSYIKAAVSV